MYLFRLSRCHAWLHFRQTLAYEEDAIYQHAVSGTLDFKIAEERVRAVQGEDFVEAVVRFAVRVYIEFCGAGS